MLLDTGPLLILLLALLLTGITFKCSSDSYDLLLLLLLNLFFWNFASFDLLLL